MPQLYEPYMKKYGQKPNFTFFASVKDELIKLRGGYVCDVTHPCTDITREFVDAGVLLPIDTSRLSNWPDVFPALQDLPGVVVEGKVYVVPADWGNSSITYRTDLIDIKPEEESWGMLFDEKYKGRIATYDDYGDVLAAALVAGYDKDQIWSLDDAALAKVSKLLTKQAGLLRFYWDDETQVEQALASGELVAAYTWNDATENLKKQGVPVRFAQPKEGILTWICGLAWVKGGTASEQQVYDFIDAWLSPETGNYLITQYNYGHSNMKSFDKVSDETLADLNLPKDPSTMFDHSILWREMEPKYLDSYINLLDNVKAAAGA